jgi:hypothetical protein
MSRPTVSRPICLTHSLYTYLHIYIYIYTRIRRERAVNDLLLYVPRKRRFAFTRCCAPEDCYQLSKSNVHLNVLKVIFYLTVNTTSKVKVGLCCSEKLSLCTVREA